MCSEYLEMWQNLLKLEVRSIEQVLIPCVGQLELPSVPIDGWIIDPDICKLPDGLVMLCDSLPIMEKLSTKVG